MTAAVDAWGVPKPAEPPGDVVPGGEYEPGELTQEDVVVDGDEYTVGIQHGGRITVKCHTHDATARESLWLAVWWAWERGVPGDGHASVRANDKHTALPTFRLGALYDMAGPRGEPP